MTDKELCEAGAGDVAQIRKFVVERDVSFSLGYNTDVISEIYIDIFTLKDKINDYIPESSYRVLSKVAILKIISNKEQKLSDKVNSIQMLKEELGAVEGDYILIEISRKEDVGIVKNITLGYDEKLRIEYGTLKKDLSESKSSVKTAGRSSVTYVIKPDVFNQELRDGALKTKDQVIRLLKEKGKNKKNSPKVKK